MPILVITLVPSCRKSLRAVLARKRLLSGVQLHVVLVAREVLQHLATTAIRALKLLKRFSWFTILTALHLGQLPQRNLVVLGYRARLL